VSQLGRADEVFGTCRGAFAEYACGKADTLAPKPANLSFEQAAGLPVSGCTALRGLRDAGAIRAGHEVLRWTGGFDRQLRAALASPFVGQRLRPLASAERREDLLFLKDVIEAGKVTPVISRTFPLAEAAKALGDADEGHGRGKPVITD
jgi:NADPH:quinone reductase-like Zn-dependent oxidoreductase